MFGVLTYKVTDNGSSKQVNRKVTHKFGSFLPTSGLWTPVFGSADTEKCFWLGFFHAREEPGSGSGQEGHPLEGWRISTDRLT